MTERKRKEVIQKKINHKNQMKCLIKFDVCIVQTSLYAVSEPHMQHDAIT